MGGCAACAGPKRRETQYKVSRLTYDSPMKNKVTVSELPYQKHKIVEELNESKKGSGNNNLISTLINSPLVNQNESRVNISDVRSSPEERLRESTNPFLREIRDYAVDGLLRDSAGSQSQNRSLLPIFRHLESKSTLEEHLNESVREIPKIKHTTSQLWENNKSASGDIKASENTLLRKTSYELRQKPRRDSYDVLLGVTGLGNIPELPDEESRTPLYVREKRFENGEDVLPTELESIPKTLPRVPELNLKKYLRDLE